MTRLLPALLVATIACAACGEHRVTVQQPIATSLDVVSSITMTSGQQVRLNVRLLDDRGQQMVMPAGLSFISRGPAEVSVDSQGMLTSLEPTPRTWVVVSLATGGKILSDSVQAVVTCYAVLIVRVTPTSMDLAVGESATAMVEFLGCGAPKKQVITWTSLNPAIASVDATSGRVTGIAPGSTTVRGNGQTNGTYLVPVTVR